MARASLAAELGAAQGDLSASLIELRGSPNADPALVSQGSQQLAVILALKSQLVTSGPKQLAAISAQIATAVASAATTARQAEQASAAGGGSASMSLTAARQAARSAVTSFNEDFYEKKILDPYLRFSSAEDEEKYRRDEVARKKEIEKAQAQHTPQGDLRAVKLAEEQLKDAGAHGGAASPAYQKMTDGLADADTRLTAALASSPPRQAPSGQSTEAPVDELDAVTASKSPAAKAIADLRASGVILSDASESGHGVTGRTQDAAPIKGRF
jgi:hypothetical protein